MAREVTDQLAQDHPDRATSVQTVRNNLETLVKKNAVEKSHQQGSAMYTAFADTAATAAADDAAGGVAEEAPETAAEKVPAEV
ncbi:BlaI/MecI/CopY family transcriptional regulator [Streptomyces sp. NPDC005393]|uniref:BlaI/MecI/CopY family transcriptional regulator n=1 Tax=Streptomyces sp. NPDC005393 TaxID=3157041 RepID=UPI0033A9B294